MPPPAIARGHLLGGCAAAYAAGAQQGARLVCGLTVSESAVVGGIAERRAACSTHRVEPLRIIGLVLALTFGVTEARAARGGAEAPVAEGDAARSVEGRPAREYFIGGGLTSMATPPLAGMDFAVGINVVLYYGGRHLAAVAQLVEGGTFEHELRPSYGGYSIGGRHRWFDSAVTPFVGAGVAASSTGFFSAGRDGKGGLGLAPYAEVGAEVFRHSTLRGMLALRVDRPLYESSRYTNRRRDAAGQTVWDSEVTRFIPISLNVSIGWGFAGRGPI